MSPLLQKLGIFSFWITWPGIWLILSLRKRRTRAVVVADGKILLVKSWLSSGAWGLPGGGLRKNENPKAGVIREIHEETGLNLEPSQVVDLEELIAFKENGIRLHLYGFLVKAPGQTALVLRRPEVAEAGWFTLENLASVELQPSAERLIETLRANQTLLK